MRSRTASHATSDVSRTASCAVAGSRQLLGGGVEDERGERLTEGGLGPLDDRPTRDGRATARPCLSDWVP